MRRAFDGDGEREDSEAEDAGEYDEEPRETCGVGSAKG